MGGFCFSGASFAFASTRSGFKRSLRGAWVLVIGVLVVGWYKLGLTPEEISERIGHLNLAQVHAALAYYHANREQVEADLTADEAEDDQAEQAFRERRPAA